MNSHGRPCCSEAGLHPPAVCRPSQARLAPRGWGGNGTSVALGVMGIAVALASCLSAETLKDLDYNGPRYDPNQPGLPVYSDIWYTLSCTQAKSRLEVAFYAYNLMEVALGDLLDANEWCIGFTYAPAQGNGACHYNITKPVRYADPQAAKTLCRPPMIDPAKRIPGEFPVGDFHPHWDGSLPSSRDARPRSEVTEVLIYGQRDFPNVGYIRFVSPRRTPTGQPRRMYMIDATTGRALQNGDGIPVPRLNVPKLELDIDAQKIRR